LKERILGCPLPLAFMFTDFLPFYYGLLNSSSSIASLKERVLGEPLLVVNKLSVINS
jgi:hypothetical protein